MALGDLEAEQLLCESMVNPVGIDIRVPRFSWQLKSVRRGVLQAAYRIMVADTEEKLWQGTGLIWDSGKVHSDESVFCAYEGEPLLSGKRYYWRVKVWDRTGAESEWSTASYWETGLLQREDWKALWIEPIQEPVVEDPVLSLREALQYNKPTDTSILHPCPLLRKSFFISSTVRKARLYATAHGTYMFQINGQKVGNQELAPEFTSYDRYLQYQTYEVTDLVKNGANAIGAILSDGWYAGRIGLSGNSCQYGDRLGLLFQLEVEYEDGTQEIVVSDHEVKCSTGHLIYSDQFIGEKVDARRIKDGWTLPDYDDSGWEPAQETHFDISNLVAHYGEPVRVAGKLPAVQVITTPKGETVVDFGQVIAGRVSMRVEGPEGTEIILEHSEVLDEHGNFLNNIMGRHKDQKDMYILRGGGPETFEPVFTFHGFRYVKVTGYPGTVRSEHFTAMVLSSDMRYTGFFECSDERINRLQQNIVWSQKTNLLSIPMDCPQRERAGWTGDIQVFAPTAAFNMDVLVFLTRWLRNLALEQLPNGEVPNVVPYHKSFRHIGHTLMGKDSSAGWGDAVIIVPWALYQAYGDVRVLEEFYDSMVRWISYVRQTAENELPDNYDQMDDVQKERQKYLWNTGFHFGDWLMPSASSPTESAMRTKEVVATSFYAYSTALLSETAAILGKHPDAEAYSDLSRRIRQAYAEEYLQDDGTLSAHFQGAYVLALQFGLVSEEARGQVADQLARLIEGNGYRLDTGFVSVPFLLDVLCKYGKRDIAYKLLYQTECPSWLYEVERGATTIWESWSAIKPDGTVSSMSFNHYAFGCVGDWLYREIAGLRKEQAGYKKINIRPAVDCGLSYASAKYESRYGTIVSGWSKQGGQLIVTAVIPPNTTGTVVLPNAKHVTVKESGTPLNEAAGVISYHQNEFDVSVQLGSGSYRFTYDYQPGSAETPSPAASRKK
ncbi:alpha-L-rhamnosidase [Paenibacillus piri]|uniref:alpha-L-rhamnosidase n=1 Tax=Paenibacillus piri TaxID=2547395 RepID=A0A4R5K7X3_9BACL|nr:alpha-L-rhamnosidase [Paenibacillus piri]TDF90587.1 alpha-L-rhamnosidase [Paenibacillus piri]